MARVRGLTGQHTENDCRENSATQSRPSARPQSAAGLMRKAGTLARRYGDGFQPIREPGYLLGGAI